MFSIVEKLIGSSEEGSKSKIIRNVITFISPSTLLLLFKINWFLEFNEGEKVIIGILINIIIYSFMKFINLLLNAPRIYNLDQKLKSSNNKSYKKLLSEKFDNQINNLIAFELFIIVSLIYSEYIIYSLVVRDTKIIVSVPIIITLFIGHIIYKLKSIVIKTMKLKRINKKEMWEFIMVIVVLSIIIVVLFICLQKCSLIKFLINVIKVKIFS